MQGVSFSEKSSESQENAKNPLDNIAKCRNNVVMSKIRDIILRHMRTSGLSIYRISKMVEGKVPQRTVYDFLSGKSDTSTEVAWILMDALGLTIMNKSTVKRGKRPRKEK